MRFGKVFDLWIGISITVVLCYNRFMKLIVLYGPPAVGKLTVAKELQKRLGYKLLYNHLIMNMFEAIFPYDHSANAKLTREFRLRIIEECLADDIDLIITAGVAGSPTLFAYFSQLIALVESKGGEVYLVQLTADQNALLERVEDDFRKQHGKTFTRAGMRKLLKEHSDLFVKFPGKEHLTIDTSKVAPKEATENIIEHYHLEILDKPE